jgi:protein-L-isoaspartate(D-aspartate) O-methyltransferase
MHADFVAAAGERLRAAGIENVELATGEAVNSWEPQGLFDAVVVTGAVYRIPERFLAWLKPGGRMLAVRGESPVQHVLMLTREGEGRFREESLFETDLPYLAHAEPPRPFIF